MAATLSIYSSYPDDPDDLVVVTYRFESMADAIAAHDHVVDRIRAGNAFYLPPDDLGEVPCNPETVVAIAVREASSAKPRNPDGTDPA